MILVTGANGTNGSELIRRLSARGIPVRALVRDAAKARLAAGAPPYLADALVELFAERRKSKGSRASPTLCETFGLTPTRLDVFAARDAAIFRGEQSAPRV